ncbi:fimbrial protein, partial [Klebsiella pneumoniae]|uniref:fimbrial protein n=1 Tax=Klebsiella pneumoniae TaxID=573 RepID=UPI0029D6217F
KACVLPENPASYRVVRTKSYLFNKANDYLKLTGYGNTGVAKGVAIKLMDSNNNHLKLGEKSAAIPLTAGAADVAFKATYAQVEGTVDAGTANGVATLLVTY